MQDALHHGNRRACDRDTLEIERHGHQVRALCVNQVPRGCVVGECPSLDKVPSFARHDRLDGNAETGTSKRSGSKQYCLAAWQELRQAVAGIPFLQKRQRLWGASRVWHLLES